jgi:hypothetical protein
MGELVEAGGAYDTKCMQGKWQVVHTQGPLLWEQFWNPFKSSKGSPNRNFQDFDLKVILVIIIIKLIIILRNDNSPLLWEQIWNPFRSSKGSPICNFQEFDVKVILIIKL